MCIRDRALGEPGTFMTQDVNIIQTQIEQRLPWIKQVSVRKQWPDELKIHLVEYVPIARWNDQHMVDAEGNTFSVPPDRTSKQVLPMLYGPEGSANEVLQGYREMGQMLAKDRFTLKEAAMTARRSWQLTLNNDIKDVYKRQVIGFVDDYRKVVRKDTKGLIARWKYFWMSVIALGVAFALYLVGKDTPATQLVVPFFKDVMPQLGPVSYTHLDVYKRQGIKRHTDATGTVNRGRYVLKCRSRRKLTLYICCGK